MFATGVMAPDSRGALPTAVARAQLPLHGEPRYRSEAELLLNRAGEVLVAGGADFDRVVRLDQFFTDWRAVTHYQAARRQRFGAYVPPSTSIVQLGVAFPEASMDVSMIAVRREADLEVAPLSPPELEVPAGAGFSPVVTVGDYVFIAGFMAAWKPGDLGGIAPEARVPSGHLWKGSPIALETEYLIQKKLVPALHAAGASLDSVVKAHVYFADITDLPGFNQMWRRYFSASPPASLVVQTARPGFAIEDSRIEINLVALRDAGTTRKQIVESRTFAGIVGQPAAVRAGDLLLVSGLQAVNANGLAPGVVPTPQAPYFGSSVERQMECILDVAEDICGNAGTSLDNVVRVQQFHTDLTEFYTAYQVWQRRLGPVPLPFSAIQVMAPHSAPGCSVLVDLWVYVPH